MWHRRQVVRANDAGAVGERDGARRARHGQQPLIQPVLHLRQRQLVRVVAEGLGELRGDLVHHRQRLHGAAPLSGLMASVCLRHTYNRTDLFC